MSEHYYAVIMAGGGGTRLWPLSRQARPKQMLQLIDDHTLFQTAVGRLEKLFPPERIYVVTNGQQFDELKNQAPALPKENFLLEPEPKGTAAAIALAAAVLQKRDPEALMAVLTADHFIGDEERFIDYLRAAEETAAQGYLVTLGVEPNYPATQYGYIQQGAQILEGAGYKVWEVKRFKEKPELEEAQELVSSGDHSWNSGMFIWQVKQIQQEFERQMPALFRSMQAISDSWGEQGQEETLKEEWDRLAIQTIDYGIMEHAENLAVIPAREMQWNDVGSWDSLFEVLKLDSDGNVVLANAHLNFDGRNSLVHADGLERMVVTIGIEDLVVVDTGDVLLICKKEQAQDVRRVIEYLKENNLEEYL